MPEHAEPVTLIHFASGSLDFAVATCRFAQAWAESRGWADARLVRHDDGTYSIVARPLAWDTPEDAT